MDATASRRLVIASLLGLLILATYRGNLGGDQGVAKRLWGIAVLGLMLTVLADFAPQVAGPLAFLVLAGYATGSGEKAITNVLGKVNTAAGGSTAAPTNTHPAGPQQPAGATNR